MAGLQYNFFPTDFFYPRASPPATTSLVTANPKLEKTQKRDGLVMIDQTRASLSLQLIREKTTNQSQTWKKKPLWIEDDM